MSKILSLTRLAIFLPVALIAIFASPVKAVANELVNPTFSSSGGGWAGASGGASCSNGNPSLGSWQQNALNFSYVWNVATQTVVISEPSLVQLSYTVQDRQEQWINGRYSVAIADSNQSTTSGILIAPNNASTFTLSVQTTQPNEVVTVSIAGDDNGLFWAGCYGPIFTNAQIVALPTSQTWIQLNEGSSGTISANTGKFTSVIFASYGTPSGSNGVYVQGSCHAQNSRSVVEGLLIGKSSASLVASNSVFGDPCAGTPKRLYVLAEYAGGTPPTTSTTSSTTTTSTTTTSTTTTSTTTTTTIPETTTSSTTTSSTTTTTSSTTTSSTTTTSTTTTTTIPETTTSSTEVKVTVPETTTTVPETTTTSEPLEEKPEVTTTTIQEISTTTTEEQSEPSPETTVPEPAPVQENEEEEETPVEVQPRTADELINNILTGDATEEEIVSFVDDVLADGVDAEAVEAIVDIINTGSLDLEKVQEIVAEILEAEITNDQAVQLATSPELLASITSDQAAEIFESIDAGEISEEEASQIVAAVQNAVESVRKAFENEINVFGGKFDAYVPTGSQITVAERRVVVAAGAVLFMAPVVSTTSINTTTSTSEPNRKQ